MSTGWLTSTKATSTTMATSCKSESSKKARGLRARFGGRAFELIVLSYNSQSGTSSQGTVKCVGLSLYPVLRDQLTSAQWTEAVENIGNSKPGHSDITLVTQAPVTICMIVACGPGG
jgi:hypothetical protein